VIKKRISRQSIKFVILWNFFLREEMFRKSITNEELERLAVNCYRGIIVMINHRDGIVEAMKSIMQCSVCGFDTESVPSFRKGESHSVSLLQIATKDYVYLIRINKTGVTPDIIRFFESSEICKVGIALKEDTRKLNKLHLIAFQNMIDLNEYCAKLGFENIGAKKLSALILGFRISKSQQISNWEAHELSEAQRRYAATDAWICREIYLKLKNNPLQALESE
jgi:ribonuclease D